jgi:hypothetical protein
MVTGPHSDPFRAPWAHGALVSSRADGSPADRPFLPALCLASLRSDGGGGGGGGGAEEGVGEEDLRVAFESEAQGIRLSGPRPGERVPFGSGGKRLGA